MRKWQAYALQNIRRTNSHKHTLKRELPKSPWLKEGEKQQSLFYLSFTGNQSNRYGSSPFSTLKTSETSEAAHPLINSNQMTKNTVKKAYAYANLTTAETAKLDEIAETLGYQSRTELYTAAAHILLYGDAAELIRQNKRNTTLNRRMQAFFAVIDEIAFPIVAVRGIAPVYTFLLDDIRRELFARTDFVPADETLKHWLKIYANINRTRLDEYCDSIRRRQYLEEQEVSA